MQLTARPALARSRLQPCPYCVRKRRCAGCSALALLSSAFVPSYTVRAPVIVAKHERWIGVGSNEILDTFGSRARRSDTRNDTVRRTPFGRAARGKPGRQRESPRLRPRSSFRDFMVRSCFSIRFRLHARVGSTPFETGSSQGSVSRSRQRETAHDQAPANAGKTCGERAHGASMSRSLDARFVSENVRAIRTRRVQRRACRSCRS